MNGESSLDKTGNNLANTIVKGGFWYIGITSFVALLLPFLHDVIHHPGPKEFTDQFEKFTGTWKEIFGVVLPVLGAWVGAVVAFFFTKSNYETAGKLFQSSRERLKSTPVKEKMIPFETIESEILNGKTEDSIYIKEDIIPKMKDKITRIPVFKKNHVALCIIHKSIAYECTYSDDDKGINLAGLLEDPKYGSYSRLVKAMAFVSELDNLATAQEKMKMIPDCQDVFVTKNGRHDEPVIGWITNADIAKTIEV